MADRSAFEGFYREHVSRVIRACRLVLVDREEAEDVAAEAFARLWSRWGAIKDDDHAGGFVFKTAMRLCTRHAKRRGRARIGGLDPPVQDDIARSLGRDEIGRALATLSVRQRQSVVLRDWAGFGTAEVARMLGTREATIRVHLHRARARLREALGADEEENTR
ncbi:MAG: RNA polymerase sigma factor [Actinomycetota bacterium]